MADLNNLLPHARSSCVLVTGGCGFIGAGFITYLFDHTEARVVNLDVLGYAADEEARIPERVRGCSARYRLVEGSIGDEMLVASLFASEPIEAVVNFAALTHVDHSFREPDLFMRNNAEATQRFMLACARQRPSLKRFVHVSTDEVYGDTPSPAPKTEEAALNPSNPYSVSKAAAEMAMRAAGHSAGLPWLCIRMNNVIGPSQHPEKLIPRSLRRLSQGLPLEVHGSGQQTRSFLYVEDAAVAVDTVLLRGRLHETYNVSALPESECTVLDMTKKLLRLSRHPSPEDDEENEGGKEEAGGERVVFVPDRPYQDKEYRIDGRKLEALGFRPAVPLDEALQRIMRAESC